MVVTALWPGSRTKTDSAGKEVRIATTSSKSGPERERGAGPGPGYHHHTRTGELVLAGTRIEMSVMQGMDDMVHKYKHCGIYWLSGLIQILPM